MPFAVVTFNTAREDFDDKNLFLATFEAYGIDTSKLHVNRAGNIPEDVHPAYKKIVYIKEYLDTGKISQVHMFDDNTKNLEVVLDLKNEYPTIGFSAWRVKNGTPEKFNRRKT
jgi:hypothetical protein